MKKRDRTTQILKIIQDSGVLRPRDLESYGIPTEYLWRLYKRKLLQHVGHGLYILPDTNATEHHTLAEACKRIPHGTVCLLSALRFHDLTTQAPFQIWMAIDEKARLPSVKYPVMKFVRFSKAALSEGIEVHHVEGVPVKVYNPAKTVVDCFKYRNKIGIDVAIEALRDCRRQRKCTIDQLWYYANICRVVQIIKPYLEATI
jgi:predicted transcriptional regulator of viral defense system